MTVPPGPILVTCDPILVTFDPTEVVFGTFLVNILDND